MTPFTKQLQISSKQYNVFSIIYKSLKILNISACILLGSVVNHSFNVQLLSLYLFNYTHMCLSLKLHKKTLAK